VSGTSDSSPSRGSVAPTGRDSDGKFLPGKSGNPSGKKAGHITKARALRERLEHTVRQHIDPADVRKVWDQVVRQALDGGVMSQKMVLEYAISKPNLQQQDNEDSGSSYTFVVVQSASPAQAGSQGEDEKPLEGDYQHVEESNEQAES